MNTYFGSNGLLSQGLEAYEPRIDQLRMAEAIHTLLFTESNGRSSANILLVEAETGIGKTLAYLLPALLSGRRTVISTATINLQDQILKKEIPLLEKLLGEDIPVACIKGRQNYLCHYRWYQYRSSQQLSLIDDDICDSIDAWMITTETGDRSELDWLPDNSSLWPKISANSYQCLGGDCPEGASCFMNNLKRQAGSSRLLIVNHHLFFSDLALRKGGYGEVLPRYEGVIFDEAHHIENVASTFFGKSFSHYQMLDLISDIERQAEADLTPSLADRTVRSVRGLKERVEDFAQIFPVQRGRFPLVDFMEEYTGWHDEIKNLSTGLERILDELRQFKEYGEGWHTLIRRGEELQGNLIEVALPECIPEDGRHIHWYERRDRSVSLSATPIKVATNLQESLYPAVEFCIMTSATLTTAGDFSYVCERLGIMHEVETLRLRSPFNYEEKTRLYIPEGSFPLPGQQRHQSALNERIGELITSSQGRALVLCTSFRGMESVADYLEERGEYPVLVQGSASRHALLQKFQNITDSVLVAVASFWEGVDVPGKALSCVIIDKLPFEVPSDPVLQARIRDIEENGGNPFFDFQVPRAILTLRQGVGRLMRCGDDEGLIAIMDGRLYRKGYGKKFLASLPPSPIIREMGQVQEFLIDI